MFSLCSAQRLCLTGSDVEAISIDSKLALLILVQFVKKVVSKNKVTNRYIEVRRG
jgi:hypothetical protein